MGRHRIQGRVVTTPVLVHDAAVGGAVYLVRADAARAVIAYSGLDIVEVLPGKAVCAVFYADYLGSDLGAYHEFGVIFLVRPPGAAARGLLAGLSEVRRARVFVHWLPVDQTFTLEAGRTIWGFPKELADIDLRLSSPFKRCVLRKDGRLVVDMLLKPGIPLPGTSAVAAPDVCTHNEGTARRVPWSIALRGVRFRPGGALIRLGNHPVAKELSELGLPKHALFTMTAAHVRMAFGPPTEV